MRILDQEGLLERQELIVFGEDFGRHAHSLEHLLRPLFRKNNIIWVETIGLRSPKFSRYDLQRIAEKLKNWLFTIGQKSGQSSGRALPPNLTVVAPIMIPFNQYSWVRFFNRWSVRSKVRAEIERRKFGQVISITSVPNASDYIGLFHEKLKVYVCVDEFSLWPGLDYELVQGMESNLLQKVDLVFATSTALQKSKSNGRSQTHLLTHGVEFEHFNIGAKPTFGRPIKICYFGLFDERTDQNLLKEIALALPEVEIHIFGKVVCEIKKVEGLANVIFRGPVSYRELPLAIAEMDIFILPYVRSELTENINPLKLKEYLSTGRPVIATALPEVVAFQEHLLLADSGASFVEKIRGLSSGVLKLDSVRAAQYIGENETWLSKAKIFSNLVKE